MYSGTTLTRMSGRIVGAHQKFDRVARKQLGFLLPESTNFPGIRSILQFEGKNGPDAIKRKSPAQDEPWHYYSPFDHDDSAILKLVQSHFDMLVKELKTNNKERSAFEAAWLAHALVDGLTPAHHYPYEEKLIELRGGKGIETRTNFREKLVMPGDTRSKKLKNNWKMWGPKGLFTAHMFFEFGVASIIIPLNFKEARPTTARLNEAKEIGVVELFQRGAREVAVLEMYETYLKKGWTPKLAWQVRHKLGPIIVQTLTLAWYLAALEAHPHISEKNIPK